VNVKILIWCVFGLLAVVWTGGSWAVAAALQWAAGLLASGEAIEVGQVLAGWSIPAWLTRWIDITAVQAVLDGVLWTLEATQKSWPWVRGLLGWLVPLTWAVWALGMLGLLGLTGLLHAVVRRSSSSPATAS
jgi:hypothetical protein